jgi:hypothetical protein
MAYSSSLCECSSEWGTRSRPGKGDRPTSRARTCHRGMAGMTCRPRHFITDRGSTMSSSLIECRIGAIVVSYSSFELNDDIRVSFSTIPGRFIHSFCCILFSFVLDSPIATFKTTARGGRRSVLTCAACKWVLVPTR